MSPTVSVVLPTHNRLHTLPRSIASVLAQTYRDLELIVVDDGSTDGTAEFVRAIDDPRVVYVRREKAGGVSVARNAGIAKARGRYIAFQDSDDEWLLEKLERQMRLMDKLGDRCGIVGCELWRYIGGAAIVVRWAEVPGDRERVSPEGHVACFSGFLQTTLFRRECLLELGPFDEELWVCEDWELTLRAIGKWTLGNVPLPLVISYESAGGLSSHTERRSFALRRIHERHRKLIDGNRNARVRYLCELAKADFYSGRPLDARRAALGAIGVAPMNLIAWGLFLGSFAGSPERMIKGYRATKRRLGLYR